jgi:CheY-like chemotaxis protein
MSKKLLLADDSITIQKVIGITFADKDYDLAVVGNGDEALEMARTDRPDLVLADVLMPGKNGYELCAAIKQDSDLKEVPVLLLTGTFESFDEDKARSAGADSWISKPFDSQALIDRVEELFANAPQPTAPAAVAESFESLEEENLWDEREEGADAREDPFESLEEGNWGGVEWEESLSRESKEPSDEDLWDSFSLDEEDLKEPTSEQAPSPPDMEVPVEDSLAEEFQLAEESRKAEAEEEKTFVIEDELTLSAASPWEESEEELLYLEESDVVEEGDLESGKETFAEQGMASASDSGEVLSTTAHAEPEPLSEPFAPAVSAVEQKVGALSEEELSQIVERVAGSVIERLANTVLEKIAWEVVPDLAESMIQEEIRRIKQGV